jgi:4-hydroxybenzoate polyprenyltransferase
LNDIVDSEIDAKIPTTESRVIASGVISKKNALFFFIFLFFLSLPLLFAFSKHILLPLVLTGLFVVIYPYSKRFFAVPQVFLGIVYASGFVIACCNGLQKSMFKLNFEIFVIYFALVLWVILYDTIYAKRDLQFDKIHNVKSSAVLFGRIAMGGLNENDRINLCLVIIAVVLNVILFCVKPAFIPLLINCYIQISSIFQKPLKGFKKNILCVLPLSLWLM